MKRFFDTAEWDDPWHANLSPKAKLVWRYLWSKCDNAGVWIENTALAEFQIGMKIDWPATLVQLRPRVLVLPNGKWWCPSFIEFQFGSLQPTANVHKSVLSLIDQHGLTALYQRWLEGKTASTFVTQPLPAASDSSHPDGMAMGPSTGQGTGQDSGTGIGVLQGKGGRAPPAKLSQPSSREQWVAFCTMNFPDWPEADIVSAYNHYDTVGWRYGKGEGKPVKNWEACARTCYDRFRKEGINGRNGHHRVSKYAGEF